MWLSHQVQPGRQAAGGDSSAFPKARPVHIPSPSQGQSCLPRSPPPGGDPGESQLSFPRPLPPPHPQLLERRVGGRALHDQIQRRWLPRGPHAKGGPLRLGLDYQRALASQTWAPRPWCATWGQGAASRPGSAPVALCYWLLRGREGGRGAGPPGARGGSPTRVRGSSQLRSPSSTSRPPGQGRPPRRRPGAWATVRRPPLPPAAPPPPLLPPGAQQPPPPEPRAAREMAPVCAPRPAEASAEAPSSRRPQARGRPPETFSATSPRPGALCPAASRGPALPKDPHLPRARNDNGRKDEESRAAAMSRPARPGSEPENKTRVGREGGASAAGRSGGARAAGGEVLRHGANMDAGPLSFVAQGAQARPGAREPASGCQTPPAQREKGP